MTDRHEHLEKATVVARLKDTPLFGGLDEDHLGRLVEMGEIVDLPAGALLIREGDAADSLYVVLAGEAEVTKRSGTSEIPVARVGPGALQGEIAALEGGRRLASVRAATEVEALRIPVSAIRELLAAGPDVALAIIRTAVSRLRVMEATLHEREKLAGLGTMAAGLAHELNNPAAAAARAVRALEEAVTEVAPPSPPGAVAPPRSPLERADRIDAVAGMTGDAERAAHLVDAGWTAEALRELPPDAVGGLAATAAIHQLLGEVNLAVGRISEIVGAVKGYVYLDQSPVQRIDVRTGLEQTLVIMRHRLSGNVEVRREIADDLPQIEAHGSELNQVWTNLVDNAIDAMEGRGTLTVRAEPDQGADGVRVSICDTGPGIPAEFRARLFEPFATTKPPGKGTGLGLHISHTVVARHGGRIDVDSEPGRTCFVVSLPTKRGDEAR